MKINLPTKLTLLRIILIPFFVAFFFIKAIPFGYIFADSIFCLAAITDFLDGYLARKLGLVTNLGKFLDPIADKVLVSTALILLLTVPEVLPPVLGAICVSVILGRELIISAFRQIAASRGVVMAADMTGKIKTCFQDFSIIVLLVCCQLIGTGAFVYFKYAGLILLGIASVLTVVSAINYILKNKQVLKD